MPCKIPDDSVHCALLAATTLKLALLDHLVGKAALADSRET